MINPWREHLSQYRTLYVGLSGGLDSMVLLHQLAQCAELVEKLIAIHIHHGLSPNADAWEKHCQSICTQWKISFHVSHVHIENKYNIEQQARLARYRVFEACIGPQDALLLAHHQDDQAETLLLQLCRGSGVHGLAAMPSIRQFAQGKLIRPLLESTRTSLRHYALKHDLIWVEDESNLNLHFSRNYIRHRVIPLLQERWPNVVKNIAECSKICQSAKKSLECLADLDLKQVSRILDISTLPLEDKDRMMNLLYVWLERNHIHIPSADSLGRLLHEVILARKDAQPLLTWGKVKIRRYRKKLYILKEEMKSFHPCLWDNFPQPIRFDENRMLYVSHAVKGVTISPMSYIEIRTRQGGERFQWHGQIKTLKNLFQEWGVPPWERDHIPLIFVDNQLKVIVGYAHADEKNLSDNSERITIYLKEIAEVIARTPSKESCDDESPNARSNLASESSSLCPGSRRE